MFRSGQLPAIREGLKVRVNRPVKRGRPLPGLGQQGARASDGLTLPPSS